MGAPGTRFFTPGALIARRQRAPCSLPFMGDYRWDVSRTSILRGALCCSIWSIWLSGRARIGTGKHVQKHGGMVPVAACLGKKEAQPQRPPFTRPHQSLGSLALRYKFPRAVSPIISLNLRIDRVRQLIFHRPKRNAQKLATQPRPAPHLCTRNPSRDVPSGRTEPKSVTIKTTHIDHHW